MRIAGVIVLFSIWAATGPNQVQAANETATATLSMSPRSGVLYREAPRPVDWRVEVAVNPGSGETSVLPTKNIRATFPVEMKFDPAPGTAVCPEDKIGPPPVNLTISPEKMIERCPDALVGNGRATINVAGQLCSFCELKDPVLLAFNGGKNENGDSELRIYAYSKDGATGLYEEAVLRNGILEVAIPQITGDSSTAIFDLNIPGNNLEHPEWNGVDPRFVKTTCSSGFWDGHPDLTLGKRDTAGNPLGPESVVRTPEFSTTCEGEAGKGKAGRVTVKGPTKVKKGSRSGFKVTLRNSGTASVSGGKVTLSGPGAGGSGKVGRIAPGSTRVVKMKGKFTRKGSIKATFRVTLNGAGSSSAARRIKVT